MFGKALCHLCQYMQCCWCLHLSVALCCTCTKKSGYCAVRLEVSCHIAEECLQRAEVQSQVHICTARRLVGCELCLCVDVAHILLVTNTGARCHKLQGVLDTDNREHKELLAILDCCLLVVLQCKNQFSCHNSIVFLGCLD